MLHCKYLTRGVFSAGNYSLKGSVTNPRARSARGFVPSPRASNFPLRATTRVSTGVTTQLTHARGFVEGFPPFSKNQKIKFGFFYKDISYTLVLILHVNVRHPLAFWDADASAQCNHHSIGRIQWEVSRLFLFVHVHTSDPTDCLYVFSTLYCQSNGWLFYMSHACSFVTRPHRAPQKEGVREGADAMAP